MENVFIIEPITDNKNEASAIKEITALVKTAGGLVKGYECIRINKINPSTYIGKGKVEEIKLACDELKCNLAVFDGELSPSQTLNLSEGLGNIAVVDRATLILDIFALSAKTADGKVQVELAQLKYLYPRLKGKGSALSRLGGGIGTRGPGETKLETDRRHIRKRINFLEARLNELETRRSLQTERRKKDGRLTASLVGYTNAGKSTLLNVLTGSDVLSEDKLFATLDPTGRKLSLDEFEVLLIDTVGFIKNIPTTLIKAFGSTLETAVDSDLNLIIVDAQDDWAEQLETTQNMLDELGANCHRLIVFNKTEELTNFDAFPKDALFVSAKNNIGLNELRNRISDILKNDFSKYEFDLPYERSSDLRKIIRFASSDKFEYLDNKIHAEIIVPKRYSSKFEELIDSL